MTQPQQTEAHHASGSAFVLRTKNLAALLKCLPQDESARSRTPSFLIYLAKRFAHLGLNRGVAIQIFRFPRTPVNQGGNPEIIGRPDTQVAAIEEIREAQVRCVRAASASAALRAELSRSV